MCKEYNVGKEEIFSSKNKHNKAKKNCIYLLKRLTGKNNKEIGKLFDIGRTAVSKCYSSFEQEMLENRSIRRSVNLQISRFKG